MDTLDRAIGQALNYHERCWDAELHRLRGEFLRLQGADPADAEAAFLRSIEIARAQQTLVYELRSAVSLARLWGEQGRQVEGKQLLVPILGRFTEGQTTADFQSAQFLFS